jgi:hypothetical protein
MTRAITPIIIAAITFLSGAAAPTSSPVTGSFRQIFTRRAKRKFGVSESTFSEQMEKAQGTLSKVPHARVRGFLQTPFARAGASVEIDDKQRDNV